MEFCRCEDNGAIQMANAVWAVEKGQAENAALRYGEMSELESPLALHIANALLKPGHSGLMTNFSKILNG